MTAVYSSARVLAVVMPMALLLASAQPSMALDQETLDRISRHLGATAEAVSKFGEIGETLTHIASGKFSGTGSQKRDMARRVDDALDPWRKASASTKASLPYTVAPNAFLLSDFATSVFAPAMEGDYRGAMGGAANIAVAPTATGAGATLFGAIGTGIGATVGSFIPVVGTALGSMVGGAIGTVAGGYVSAAAYDIYVKDLVQKGVEGGIAAVFDVAPLQQAMMARDAFLREQGADDLKRAWADLNMVSKDFNPEGVELVWPGSTPYIVQTPPGGTTPLPPEPGAVGDLLAGIKGVVLSVGSARSTTCMIDDGKVNCSLPPPSIGPAVRELSSSLSGVVDGNTLVLEFRAEFEAKGTNDCTTRTVYRGPEKVVLETGGKTLTTSSITMTVSGDCSGPMTTTHNYSSAGLWHVVE